MNDLKLLAEAVAGRGNCTEAWLDTSEDDASAVFGHIDEYGNTYPVAVIDCEQYYAGHDSLKLAKFYAAANPTAVLNLITELASRDAEIESLRQQLTDSQKREVMLRDAVNAIWDNPHWKPHGMPVVIVHQLQEALAATADLENVRLCEKEPVGYDVKTMDGKKMLMRSFCNLVGHKSESLYRAWEPK